MPTTDPTPIEVREDGDEAHPSWAVASVSRITASPPVELFDSSIPHTHFMRLSITPATRRRDLRRDWIQSTQQPYIEVDMTLSQWGAFVSNVNSGGSPVTLAYLNGEDIPAAADDEPRLAVTAREVSTAAAEGVGKVEDAVRALVAAFDAKAGRRELADKINDLSRRVQGLPGNMKYAADSLTEHAEKVVEKARADIEAMAAHAAARAGVQVEPGASPLELLP